MKKVSNPPNPFSTQHLEWIDTAPDAHLQIFEESARSIISENDSPDISFTYSVNPYRGCFHACSYCYARRTHQYLDFGAGSDFERKIVVKINAAEKLREAFLKPSWQGDGIVFSGVTDCYQPLEASYELTRDCLAVCAEFQNPAYIITKGALVRRDIDLLARLNDSAGIFVYHSIAFADDSMSKLLEPGAPRPSVRFRAMRELSAAGIPVGVAVAPIIPGLNDRQIPAILNLAKEAGARSAFMSLLRLPAEVKDVFLASLHENFPTHENKVIERLKDLRGGETNRPQFGARMRGEGPHWDAIRFLFNSNCEKLGLNKESSRETANTFRRPQRQLGLF